MYTYDEYLKKVGEIGYVRSVMNGMVYASGLPSARVMELVVTETGQNGIVQYLLPESVEILMLDGRPVRHGTAIARTNEILRIPVGDQLLGRAIDPFVHPIDAGKPFYPFSEHRDFENEAPPIFMREKINERFTTGVTIVDLMVPLGLGQRELVIGDQKSGKTSFLMQVVRNQAAQGTICVYVAIGKKKATIKRMQTLFARPEFNNSVVLVAADASSPASFIYLVPFTGMSIAEYFRDKGSQVLIVFDDLNIHAKLYREIALLAKKTPGRESYPGDIFYLHSHLVERAGKVKIADNKTASITLLASIETVGGEFTGYIQTNAMSMTDGHIFFDLEMFRQGRRPSVNIERSVSRVGRQTQSTFDREISEAVSSILTEYRSAQGYARFGVELTEKTRQVLSLGEKLLTVMNQDQNTIVPSFLQNLYCGLLLGGFWNNANQQQIALDKVAILMAYQQGRLKELEKVLVQVTSLQQLRELIAQNSDEIGQLIKGGLTVQVAQEE